MDKLQELIDYYEKNIEPYRYEIYGPDSLLLKFSIQPANVPHLIFGTVKDKGIAYFEHYQGKVAYDRMKNAQILFDSLPQQIKSTAQSRALAFFNLDRLLEHPKGIFFSSDIVKSGNFKLRNTLIDADYLIYNENIKGQLLHLFLGHRNNAPSLCPISFFPQNSNNNNYIIDQKKFIATSKKIEIIKNHSN